MKIDKGKILLVDDEKLILSTLQYKLSRQGYLVTAVENGQEALRLIRDNEYDLVLLDIKLWDIDGITILEKIKNIWPDTIVIMITGHASVDTAIRALRLGAHDYVIKPINDSELKIRIERGMSKREDTLQAKFLNQQIARSKQLLQTTFDGLVDGIVLVDGEHKILSLNKSAINFREISFTTALGKKYCDALWGIKESCRECPINETQITSKRRAQEKVLEKRGERKITLEISSYPVLDEEGNILQIVVYERNISEEKLLMEQLIRSEKLAELGKMSAAIGHELSNYLNGISLRLQRIPQLLQRGQTQKALTLMDDVKEYMDGMTRFAHGLQDAGQTTPQMRECDLNEMINRIIDFLKPQNKFDQIKFTQKLSPNLPNLWIDSGQIEQVFINLFNNAAEAMGKGEILVSTKVIPKNGYLEVAIRDYGPGIPKEYLAEIFKPYFTTKKSGHGLGLAICYNIIRAHGGFINVSSDLGKGTTFTIRLPLSRER
jgi:signal transduction histidine kinase/DNA-binding response OmpR family regulator